MLRAAHGNLPLINRVTELQQLCAAWQEVVARSRTGPAPDFCSRARARARQADLIRQAFARLGIERPVVVGHSFGTLVALALALERTR
jgi:pimeloyl-ACP methyl ester carboxylesterase